MYDIFICDDEKNITEFIKFFIIKHFKDKFEVITMNGCRELLGMIEMAERVPDILIMDINLKDGNGIDTVRRIQDQHPTLKVIYLTGVIKYATAIFETKPAYFLTKPIDEKLLHHAISKISGEIETERSDSIVIKANGTEILLCRRDIMFVESQGRKLLLHLTHGKKIEIYEKMDILQDRLGNTFVRSHKSFLINMKYINERTNQEFILYDGSVLPISKSNLREAKNKFISYLGEA